MSAEIHRKYSGHDGGSPEEKDFFIRTARSGVDIIDYLFDLIIPQDAEMRYPDDYEWGQLTLRIVDTR